MIQEFVHEIKVQDYFRAALPIIGPRSRFSDSHVPLVDISIVPSRQFEGGIISFKGLLPPSVTRDYRRRRDKLIWNTRRTLILNCDRYLFDLRQFGASNWSHALNQALPVAIFLQDYLLSLRQSPPLFAVSTSTSQKAISIFSHFGIECVVEDGPIFAPLIEIDLPNEEFIIRCAREFIEKSDRDVDQFIELSTLDHPKIFLNREGKSRSIRNCDEIQTILSDYGYKEIFMEDYDPADQVALIVKASGIVAIHGAGLAPLLLRNPKHGPFEFIEIASPGHVVPFFRDLARDLPMRYRMLRGVPDKQMIDDAFPLLANPSVQWSMKHGYKSFFLDPHSLKVALNPKEIAAYRNHLI